jgi:hypothetical protein
VVVLLVLAELLVAARPAMAWKPFRTQGVAVSAGVRSISVSWYVFADDGSGSPVDRYMVTVIPFNGTPINRQTSAGSIAVNYLKPGIDYLVYVASHNSEGWGLPGGYLHATPLGEPSEPAPPTGKVVGSQSMVFSWAPPSYDGGSPITGYQLSVNGTHYDYAAAVHEFEFNGLDGGIQVQVRVRAKNAVAGFGLWSQAAMLMPLGPPGKPQDLKASPLQNALKIEWTEPNSDGGRPIVAYDVTVIQGTRQVKENAVKSPLTINGLRGGEDASVLVRAVNFAADGLDPLVSENPADILATPLAAPPSTTKPSSSPSSSTMPGPKPSAMAGGSTPPATASPLPLASAPAPSSAQPSAPSFAMPVGDASTQAAAPSPIANAAATRRGRVSPLWWVVVAAVVLAVGGLAAFGLVRRRRGPTVRGDFE